MLHEGNQEKKDKIDVNEEIDNLVSVLLAARKIACDNLINANNHLYMIGRCAPVAAWLSLQVENANCKAMHDLVEEYKKVEKNMRSYEERHKKSEEDQDDNRQLHMVKKEERDEYIGRETMEIGVLHAFCCTIEKLLDDIKERAREIDSSVVIGKSARIVYKN
jgi:hypothetical protein